MAELMVTARMIMSELQKRGFSVNAEIPESVSVLSFEYGGKQRLLMGCTPDFASAVSIPICRSKLMTKWIVNRDTDVPTPETLLYENQDEARAFLAKFKRIVVKPQDGAHGRGVTVGVESEEALEVAIEAARKESNSGTVLLQELANGQDVRVMVIDGHVVAATYRIAPAVIGDGAQTIRQLIEHENSTNPDRGERPYDKKLNKIDTAAAERFLGANIDTVPTNGDTVQVVGTANIGTGGEAHECLNELPDTLKQHAIDAAKAARTFICGVDFMYDRQSGAYRLIELNSSPSFGLHATPSEGTSISLAPVYVDALFANYDKEIAT